MDICGDVLETEKLVALPPLLFLNVTKGHAIRRFVRILNKMPFIILSFIRWDLVFLQKTLFARLWKTVGNALKII